MKAIDSLAPARFDLSVRLSMSRASPRLHSCAGVERDEVTSKNR
jgi:hypothetical protein